VGVRVDQRAQPLRCRWRLTFRAHAHTIERGGRSVSAEKLRALRWYL
jgi:hypothetical protein